MLQVMGDIFSKDFSLQQVKMDKNLYTFSRHGLQTLYVFTTKGRTMRPVQQEDGSVPFLPEPERVKKKEILSSFLTREKFPDRSRIH
jgi:hypothetical protein